MYVEAWKDFFDVINLIIGLEPNLTSETSVCACNPPPKMGQ